MIEGYRKALKVIDSCENEDHIKGAKRYCSNFFSYHAQAEGIRYGTEIFSLDTFYASAYERLLKKIHLKRQSF